MSTYSLLVFNITCLGVKTRRRIVLLILSIWPELAGLLPVRLQSYILLSPLNATLQVLRTVQDFNSN